jgi:hypothetical protein
MAQARPAHWPQHSTFDVRLPVALWLRFDEYLRDDSRSGFGADLPGKPRTRSVAIEAILEAWLAAREQHERNEAMSEAWRTENGNFVIRGRPQLVKLEVNFRLFTTPVAPSGFTKTAAEMQIFGWDIGP